MCLFFSVCFWFSDGGFELLIAGLRTVKIVSIGLVRRNWHLFALPTILIYHHPYSESSTQPQSPGPIEILFCLFCTTFFRSVSFFLTDD